MGQYITKAIDSLSSKKERRILMLGLDAAGKSTILYQMKLQKSLQCEPTFGYNLEQVQYKNLKLNICDIGGQVALRKIWYHQFKENNALIFVIDSADVDRIELAKQELEMIFSSADMAGIPVLIFANKQDIAQLSTSQIADKLELFKINGVGDWQIQGCCALSGKGIYEGFDWLSKVLNKSK